MNMMRSVRAASKTLARSTSFSLPPLFSSSSSLMEKQLRIGYVPEHFSTPLHFAYEHYGLKSHAKLRSFPSGTGTMIEAFKNKEIDIGIGLTEAWVAGLGKEGWLDPSKRASNLEQKKSMPYYIGAAYTRSSLRWALSTGANRADVNSMDDVQGGKVGISRIGSGSHIMAQVLADQKGWSQPFEFVVCGPFKDLRDAVNSGKADFFMWEHFTTKMFWDNGELKRIGEIPTPWNAWHIAVAPEADSEQVTGTLYPALTRGIEKFNSAKSESVEFIHNNMDYSREDAEAWYGEVQFPDEISEIQQSGIESAIISLQKAGVLDAAENAQWHLARGIE